MFLLRITLLKEVTTCFIRNSSTRPVLPFAREKFGDFIQDKPILKSPFIEDAPLQRFLNYCVPKEISKEMSQDLRKFSLRVINEIDKLGWECELNLPSLRTFDSWGNRIDELNTCTAWKRQHDISAEEGLVAIAYERKLHEWSRLHQICKLYLYAPSAGLYTCPIAMTDGAAKIFEKLSKEYLFLKKPLSHLTTRNPKEFWTSGQWMTEKRGGSDVANSTETFAIPDGKLYRLYGYKWFTSAADSNIALTLAKEIGHDEINQKDKDPDLFFLETRTSSNKFNNLQIVKLKNKLGTRQLPTSELLLDGSIAYKISNQGRGIPAISDMLTITRLHNSMGAVAGMRRILMLIRDYSHRRHAFGHKLSELPLHMHVLAKMEMEIRGSLLFLLKVAIWLGRSEAGIATDDENLLLRLMTPVLKLFTAKQAVSLISEGVEAFGGQGYIEDTGIPQMLRDAQVLPIWEGTTNIMALDVMRSIFKANFEVLNAFQRNVKLIISYGKKISAFDQSCAKIEKSTQDILAFINNFPDLLNISARDISFSIARTYIGALLIENASTTKNCLDIISAQRWCNLQDLCSLSQHYEFSCYSQQGNDFNLVMEGYKDSN